MTDSLAVWLQEDLIGHLRRDRRTRHLGFRYSEGAQERWLGRPLVSVSMPVATRWYPDAIAHPYFDGLLPEGEVRRTIAYDLGVEAADSFGLLAELGRDCAGAITIQPADHPGPGAPHVGKALPLTEEELHQRIRDLALHPLGVDGLARASLAGVQQKLLVLRLGENQWGLPGEGSASTHILKPANPDLPGSAINEALCMRSAANLGLPTPEVTLLSVDGRDVLAVARFDRTVNPDGTITRTHQEDICQALSVSTLRPNAKYEHHGGPSLADVASLLRRWGDAAGVGRLVEYVTLNALIGNADAHGKNLSICHDPSGSIRLAPLYDSFATVAYPLVSEEASMRVNGKSHVNEITATDIIAEARAWGVPLAQARDAVSSMVERFDAAVGAAADITPEASDKLVSLLMKRSARLVQPGAMPSD